MRLTSNAENVSPVIREEGSTPDDSQKRHRTASSVIFRPTLHQP